MTNTRTVPVEFLETIRIWLETAGENGINVKFDDGTQTPNSREILILAGKVQGIIDATPEAAAAPAFEEEVTMPRHVSDLGQASLHLTFGSREQANDYKSRLLLNGDSVIVRRKIAAGQGQSSHGGLSDSFGSQPVLAAPETAPTQNVTDEQGRPMTYWGGLKDSPAKAAEAHKLFLKECASAVLDCFLNDCQEGGFTMLVAMERALNNLEQSLYEDDGPLAKHPTENAAVQEGCDPEFMAALERGDHLDGPLKDKALEISAKHPFKSAPHAGLACPLCDESAHHVFENNILLIVCDSCGLKSASYLETVVNKYVHISLSRRCTEEEEIRKCSQELINALLDENHVLSEREAIAMDNLRAALKIERGGK